MGLLCEYILEEGLFNTRNFKNCFLGVIVPV